MWTRERGNVMTALVLVFDRIWSATKLKDNCRYFALIVYVGGLHIDKDI